MLLGVNLQVRRITNVEVIVLIVLLLRQMPEISNLRREGFILAQSARVHIGLVMVEDSQQHMSETVGHTREKQAEI